MRDSYLGVDMQGQALHIGDRVVWSYAGSNRLNIDVIGRVSPSGLYGIVYKRGAGGKYVFTSWIKGDVLKINL